MRLPRRLFPPATKAARSNDAGTATARLRLLIAADRTGPTFQINFARPLAAASASGDVALVVLKEKAIRRSILAANVPWAALVARAWLRRLRPHAVILSRCADAGTLRIAEAARALGIPCLYHIDDDLLHLPEDLGAATRRKHGDPKRGATIRALLRVADLAYVSTPGLRDALAEKSALPPNVFVGEIAAAAEPAACTIRIADRANVFGYMGSRSHAADLAMIAPAIRDALDRHPGASFEIFGTVETPSALEGRVARRHAVIDDYDRFLRHLSELDWRFGLAPLRNNPFNACKTDTKWVEYAAAGIAVLASDTAVYGRAGAAGAATLVGDDGWADALDRALGDAAYLQSLQDAARSLLARSYRTAFLRRQIGECLRRAGVEAAALLPLAD